MFTLLLGITALLVAGCAAYFSVLGIATLFMGSYYQVMVMAGSLEIGKLVATSYLYRYWNKTTFALKCYLMVAVLTLMGITSLGVFGYLSAAYQVSASKSNHLEQQIAIVEQQKQTIQKEIEQINQRITLLNEVRAVQEKRVQEAGNYKAPREQAYAAIDKANEEIKTLTARTQELNNGIIENDKKIGDVKLETLKNKDIGTFKFIAETLGLELDVVVKWFILIIVLVFDPLAVSLVLAFNVATRGSILKEEKAPTPVVETESTTQETAVEEEQKEETPTTTNRIHVTGKLR
jgi:cell division protein FtsB